MTLAELQTEWEQVNLLREEFQQEVGIFETLLDRVNLISLSDEFGAALLETLWVPFDQVSMSPLHSLPVFS